MDINKESVRTQEHNHAEKTANLPEHEHTHVRTHVQPEESPSQPSLAVEHGSGAEKASPRSGTAGGSAVGHTHTHVLKDGTIIQHSHTHTHENTKAVLNRLSRAIGHLESVKRMVEDGRDCSEVLVQLSAVKSAINNTGKIILQDHIRHCLVDAVQTGDMEEIEELNKAIEQFIK